MIALRRTAAMAVLRPTPVMLTLTLLVLGGCSGVEGPAEDTGSIEVTTTTTGTFLDSDGYAVTVDGGEEQSIGVNEMITLAGLSAGDHDVELTDLASNCQATGANPQTVTVVAGETASASFDVDCESVALEIAFVRQGDNGSDIWAMASDGSNPMNLTNDPGFDGSPAWSPDGSKIAFSTDRDGNGEVYVMDADGSNPMNLTNDPAGTTSPWDTEPAWSPDGTKIAFARAPSFLEPLDIYVMDADGSNRVKLTNVGREPAWSPDGTKIAFVRGDEVYVMDADGSNPVNLTNAPGFDGSPAWSPDGTKIAFSTDRGVPFELLEIYVMDADGSNPVNLTSAPAHNNEPAWSPDGTKIAFSSDRTMASESWIYVMDADGSNPVNLTHGPAHDNSPAWSPSP